MRATYIFGTLEKDGGDLLFTSSVLVAAWLSLLPSMPLNLPFEGSILEPEGLRERLCEIAE